LQLRGKDFLRLFLSTHLVVVNPDWPKVKLAAELDRVLSGDTILDAVVQSGLPQYAFAESSFMPLASVGTPLNKSGALKLVSAVVAAAVYSRDIDFGLQTARSLGIIPHTSSVQQWRDFRRYKALHPPRTAVQLPVNNDLTDFVADIIGREVTNPQLFVRAFTHPSTVEDHPEVVAHIAKLVWLGGQVTRNLAWGHLPFHFECDDVAVPGIKLHKKMMASKALAALCANARFSRFLECDEKITKGVAQYEAEMNNAQAAGLGESARAGVLEYWRTSDGSNLHSDLAKAFVGASYVLDGMDPEGAQLKLFERHFAQFYDAHIIPPPQPNA